jgi:hypothetical protein
MLYSELREKSLRVTGPTLAKGSNLSEPVAILVL